ncbi:hypothetical protein CFN78_00165 [Amycolatopsis antarctica]|uniref:SRPBCC family protein n=1 Tax=Amycolatopsis antarctica TaxID=1854586 RepID=A0A263D871_9PSEU|nr:hypothetical protein [Amycolatopsis antarctica]OZM74702.1 hypothetical protein CFN78_00165 [Amycolatopsis antarctica]
MGDYKKSITVQVSAPTLFSYLADVTNLPEYMPRLTSARPAGGDKVDVTAHINPEGAPEQDVEGKAWVHVITDGRKLEWGAAGPHDYHGELDIEAGPSEGNSVLTVGLHTERTEGEQVDRGLTETLTGIKDAAERAARP